MKTMRTTSIVVCALLILLTGCAVDTSMPDPYQRDDNAANTETVSADMPLLTQPEEIQISLPTVEKEPKVPEKQPPKEDTLPTEKKAVQASPAENPKEQQNQPTQESKSAEAPQKEEKASPEPSTPPQASPNTPTPRPAPVEEHRHSYTETVVVPTCESGGCTRYVCSCGESYTVGASEPLGHAYTQTGHADSTTSAEGWTEYTCSRCGATYRDAIPKIMLTGASAADAQRVCDEVNCYIRSHYAVTQNRGTYMGITWVQSLSDVQGAINSTIGTVDLYAQYYGAKSFCCGYLDDGESYTIVLYWDTI